MVLQRETEVKAYQFFNNLVNGGLRSGWIHVASATEPKREGHLFGIGNGEGWQELYIVLKELTPAQEALWNDGKDNVGATPYRDVDAYGLHYLGFTSAADGGYQSIVSTGTEETFVENSDDYLAPGGCCN